LQFYLLISNIDILYNHQKFSMLPKNIYFRRENVEPKVAVEGSVSRINDLQDSIEAKIKCKIIFTQALHLF